MSFLTHFFSNGEYFANLKHEVIPTKSRQRSNKNIDCHTSFSYYFCKEYSSRLPITLFVIEVTCLVS